MHHIPEGHTILIVAPQRYGKTLLAVMLAHDYWTQGRTIFSNIPLEFPHQRLRFSELSLDNEEQTFYNSCVLIDELNFMFDSRGAMTKGNRRFAPYLLQMKKKGATLLGTSHGLDQVDIRLQRNYDYAMYPSAIPAYPETPHILRVDIENGPLAAPMNRTIFLDCRDYLGLYDTTHTFDPFEELEPPEPRRRPRVQKPESRVQL